VSLIWGENFFPPVQYICNTPFYPVFADPTEYKHGRSKA